MNWVYIIRCNRPRHYYVGQTSNLMRRMREHRRPANSFSLLVKAGGYQKLVWAKTFSNREDAEIAEKEVAVTMATPYRHIFTDADIMAEIYYWAGSNSTAIDSTRYLKALGPIERKRQMDVREMILAGRTEGGGWTRKQLEEWGVWPPVSGWRERLILGEPARLRT